MICEIQSISLDGLSLHGLRLLEKLQKVKQFSLQIGSLLLAGVTKKGSSQAQVREPQHHDYVCTLCHQLQQLGMRKTFPRRGTKVLTYSKVARNTFEAVRRQVHLRATPPPQPHLSPSAIPLFLTQLLRTLAIFRCGILISYFYTCRKKSD